MKKMTIRNFLPKLFAKIISRQNLKPCCFGMIENSSSQAIVKSKFFVQKNC
eukprot:UN15353